MRNNMHNTISIKSTILFYEHLWNKGKIRIDGPAFRRMVFLKKEYRNKILWGYSNEQYIKYLNKQKLNNDIQK